MEVFAHGSFGPKPLRLRLPERWSEVDLDELGSACHLLIRFYMADCRFATTSAGGAHLGPDVPSGRPSKARHDSCQNEMACGKADPGSGTQRRTKANLRDMRQSIL